MGIGFDGQGEMKTCTTGRIVLGPQAAAMRLHDRPADPKSHAGTMRFGGKEGVENLVRLRRRESNAGIADRDLKVLMIRSLRLDDELARSLHILHCIDAIDH